MKTIESKEFQLDEKDADDLRKGNPIDFPITKEEFNLIKYHLSEGIVIGRFPAGELYFRKNDSKGRTICHGIIAGKNSKLYRYTTDIDY